MVKTTTYPHDFFNIQRQCYCKLTRLPLVINEHKMEGIHVFHDIGYVVHPIDANGGTCVDYIDVY